MVLGNVISIFLYAVVYVHDYSYDSIYACPLFLFLIIIKLFIASSRATIDLILHPYPYKKNYSAGHDGQIIWQMALSDFVAPSRKRKLDICKTDCMHGRMGNLGPAVLSL